MPGRDSKHDALTAPSVPQTPLAFQRDDDFVARYANNVQVELSDWDLKLIFGLLDQRNATKPVAEQHTSINLSWPEVKIAIYLLQVHLAIYEQQNGKIRIPAGGLPPPIPDMLPPQFDNPQGQAAFEMIRKMREEFLSKLNEP